MRIDIEELDINVPEGKKVAYCILTIKVKIIDNSDPEGNKKAEPEAKSIKE